MSKLTTNKTELIKPNIWANKLDNKPIKKAWLAQEFRGVEMSTLTSLAVTTCLYSINHLSRLPYLSFSPTVSSQTTKANHHRKKEKKKQLRDRHHPPEKTYNGDCRQVIQRSILLWFVCYLCFWFFFFFPRKRNVRRSWSVFAFFVCWMVQMRDWRSRATSLPNIQIEFRSV